MSGLLADKLGLEIPALNSAALVVGAPVSMKWAVRPGNAMMRSIGSLFWFDWEHCGVRSSGDDIIVDGGGHDEVVYTAAENLGASYDYCGGHCIDTLTLNLTAQERFLPEVQADIAAYLQFIAANIHPNNGEANSAEFQFTAFDLKACEFEDLRVLVDGVALDPSDRAVTPPGDTAAFSKGDSATACFGLVEWRSAGSGPAEGVLSFHPAVPTAPDGSGGPAVGATMEVGYAGILRSGL